MLGHFVGAVYALTQAESVRAPDRDDDTLVREYPAELRRISAALARGNRRPPAYWVAEFYVNSGLYRLASLAERLAKYRGQDRRLIKDVSNDVNQMKHEITGRLVRRSVRLPRAVAAASRVASVIESVMGESRSVDGKSYDA